jgi:hypothetical protein
MMGMSSLEESYAALKKGLADYYRARKDVLFVVGNKVYTGPELAKEIENETYVGKLMIKIALKGTTHDMAIRWRSWAYTTQ